MDIWESGWKLLLQAVFLLGLSAIFLNWMGSKLKEWNTKRSSDKKSKTEDPDVIRHYKDQQCANVKQIQETYNEKSQEYKQKVLIPREEAKRRKKEEDFARLLGPAWKGEGNTLGGDGDDGETSTPTNVSESRRAAQQRRGLEDINEGVAAAVAAESIAAATRRLQQAKVIKLPVEPSEDDPDAVTVKFRTPLGTSCSRRFQKYSKFQCLLDYITTLGFSQKVYNISTSYPRRVLHNPDALLTDLGFGQKVALNIEEKE